MLQTSARPVLRRPVAALLTTLLTATGLGATATPAQAVPAFGEVGAWGMNSDGQGVVPPGLAGEPALEIAAGGYHNLALTMDGIAAWGLNDFGQTTVPGTLAGASVRALSAGERHSLALTTDGRVTAWGYNSSGQGGVPGGLTDQTVTAIDAGRYHNLAIVSGGQVVAWGLNNYGQASVPGALTGEQVTAVSAGGGHNLAVTSDGQVVGWGDDGNDQASIPASLADETVTAVSAGAIHSLALTAEGEVVAWGWDAYGQASVPESLTGKTVTAVAAGTYHSAALTSEGEVVAWGWNVHGQGSTPQGLSGRVVTALVVGDMHNLVTSAVESFDPGVSATITGTPKLGEVLTADAGTVSPTPDATTYRWSADGTEIAGATGPSFTPTAAEVGTEITVEVTATKARHAASSDVSEPTLPVEPGDITVPTPVLSGTPVVGGSLGVSLLGPLDPADAAVGFAWFRGDTQVGTGSSYSPTPADAGAVLTATATATKDAHRTAAQSVESGEVAPATFTAAPVATIAGTLKVGETLSADPGVVAPAPDALGYRWYADDVAIPGATAATYTLTSAEKGASLTVEVTATRAGYGDSVDVSEATAAVATDQAPELELSVADPTLRRGQATTLSWTSADADTLSASGGWSGVQDPAGSVPVSPQVLGRTTYVLEASNANGTTTAQAAVEVSSSAATLVVGAPRDLRLATGGARVTARGLEAQEAYAITVGGTEVATGLATAGGLVSRWVRLPARARDGRATVRVTGSEPDRTGSATVRVVTGKTLGSRISKVVAATQQQRVTITGLASREPVTVKFRGTRVSPRLARASTSGVYRLAFRVGRERGPKVMRATGRFPSRAASMTFRVVGR